MKKNKLVLYQGNHEIMGKGWAGELFMPNRNPEKVFIKTNKWPTEKAFRTLCLNYNIRRDDLDIDIYVYDI